MLERLERDNLFIVPLDDERRWYRYHRLFADLLLHRLRLAQPELLPELHRRASRWYQEEGALEEAMIHAMAAQDFERAAAMIEENIVGMLARSEVPVLLGWIERMPKQYGREAPLRCDANTICVPSGDQAAYGSPGVGSRCSASPVSASITFFQLFPLLRNFS